MTEPRAVADATPHQDDPRRWRILSVSLVVGFMVLLDVTIVNIALPSISQGLDAAQGTVQWVVSGYALAFGLTLVTGGRLGDAYGRRRLMAIGLVGFVVSSAAAGLAPDIGWLIVARLVQGASAGLLTPQNTGLIQTLFRGPERGRAFGRFGFVVSVSSALGPLVGGVIIALSGSADGWRWVFLVNVPIGLVLLWPILTLVPGRDAVPRTGRSRARLDLLGAVLLGAAVLCLLFPVISVEGGALLPLLLLLLVGPLLLVFVRWERRITARGGAPLLDVGLLRQVPGYASGVLIGSLYFTGFTGVFLVLSIYLQSGRGLSPLDAALVLTPFAVGAALSSPVAGRVVSRVGRVLTVWAVAGMMTALVVIALLAVLVPTDAAPAWLLLSVPLLVAGIAGGGVISPNFTLALSEVPPRMGGAAGAAMQTGQRIGTAIGAALVMTVYQLLVAGTGDTELAVAVAIGTAVLILSTALVAAIWSWRHEQRPSSLAGEDNGRGDAVRAEAGGAAR